MLGLDPHYESNLSVNLIDEKQNEAELQLMKWILTKIKAYGMNQAFQKLSNEMEKKIARVQLIKEKREAQIRSRKIEGKHSSSAAFCSGVYGYAILNAKKVKRKMRTEDFRQYRRAMFEKEQLKKDTHEKVRFAVQKQIRARRRKYEMKGVSVKKMATIRLKFALKSKSVRDAIDLKRLNYSSKKLDSYQESRLRFNFARKQYQAYCFH